MSGAILKNEHIIQNTLLFDGIDEIGWSDEQNAKVHVTVVSQVCFNIYLEVTSKNEAELENQGNIKQTKLSEFERVVKSIFFLFLDFYT